VSVREGQDAPGATKIKRPQARSGRPSLSQSEGLEEHILAAATELFLTQGYGATSIEAVAQKARISKRTFYHRFDDKADLFAAVVHRLFLRLRPAEKEIAALFEGGSLCAMLTRIGQVVLHAALREEALGLHRLLVAEAMRFPELALIFEREGSRQEAIERIGALLRHACEHVADPMFAAEQFLQMMISVPQRHALGVGTRMTPQQLEAWVAKTVELFLGGIRA
jgi:AcrR family transcriptional regulator